MNEQYTHIQSLVAPAVYLVLVVLAVRLLCITIYRVWFHPLAKYPGPRVATVTDLWSVWHSVRGDSHLQAYILHQKYGPIVRTGPSKLDIAPIDVVQETFRSDKVLKWRGLATINPVEGAFSTFSSIDREMHRKKRRVFGQAFTESAFRAFEPTLTSCVDTFVRQLAVGIPKDGGGRWSKAINMSERSRFYAVDVMGEFGFGKSFETQTRDENKFLLKATDGAIIVAGAYCQYPELKSSLLGRFVALAGKRTKERFGKLARKLIDERLGQTGGERARADILHFVSSGAEEKIGQSFSLDEVWSESRSVLVAGAGTVTTAVTSTFFYLSRNPSSYAKLVKQIRTAFASPADIRCGKELDGCGYLWNCIDEALRLCPPIAVPLLREVCEDDFTLSSMPVAKGTCLTASAYCLHHDETIFPDPFAFQPERWQMDATDGAIGIDQERIARQRLAFNPFGFATRKCIAYKMAYMEIALCIARTLWELDLRCPEGDLARVGTGGGDRFSYPARDREEEFQLWGHVTCQHDGPYLEWSRRTL